MGFINFPSPTPIFPVLPPKAWSVHKEPAFSTLTNVAISGREYQLVRQVVPIWEFTLTYGGTAWVRDQTQNITPYGPLAGFTELEQLAGLFLACLGSYGEFYYEDPDDNSRLGTPIGDGDGTVTDFGAFFSWGTGPFNPSAYYPVTGLKTIDAVYFNGVLQSPAIYSIDASGSGIQFTLAPGPGTVITADIHFYFRCRFLNDIEEFEQWAWNLWEKKQLKFKSVKP